MKQRPAEEKKKRVKERVSDETNPLIQSLILTPSFKLGQ